jgi:DnaA family protein
VTQLLLQGLQPQSHKNFANFYAGQNQNIIDYLQKECLDQKGSIYLWGSPNCGLSHLLQAVCEEAIALQKTAMYLPLKEAHQYTPEILIDVEQMDVLCVDDIDAILGQMVWEEALFDAYNRLRDNNKLWLCSARTSVRGLNCLLADLQSRLAWGQVFHIASLTEVDTIAALQLRATERGMIVGDEVMHFLLTHYQRDLNALLLLLEKLDAASLAQKKRITVPFVKDMLG